MTGRNKKSAELYYRSIRDGESVLALLGTDYKEETPSKKHFHNLLEIAICRSGQGEIVTENNRYYYSEGTVMIVPANVVHAIICEDEARNMWEYIYINPIDFMKQTKILQREWRLAFSLANECMVVRNAEEAEFVLIEANLIMNYLRVKEYGYRQCVWGLVYTLLMEVVKINYEKNEKFFELNKQPELTSEHIIRALDYIEEHYHEKIRVNDIAKESYISPTCLRKQFQDYFMMSPMQYVNYVRIQKACELIRKTEDSFAEVARKSGYDNMATFINNFKLYTGDVPRMWKEKIRTKQ